MDTGSSVREFLFTLLLKVAVASSFAALLLREQHAAKRVPPSSVTQIKNKN